MRDISLHIMDIIQNSISAKADKISIEICCNAEKDELTIKVMDNGCGMEKDMLAEVTDPFITTRKTRKVGLGISLLNASAQRASGNLNIRSIKGMGTEVEAKMRISHIDRLPLGSISDTIMNSILGNPDLQFTLLLDNKEEQFIFDTDEVKLKLQGVDITDGQVLLWIKDYVDEGINRIFGGVLIEVNS